MSSWGLPTDFLDRLEEPGLERPWDLDPKWLRPAKVIRDPIEDDVGILELERWLIDSPPMQRLRRTRQLGTTHYVFPGATHSRFSHSVGAIGAAQKLLNAVMEQRHHPHATPDLLGEWKETLTDNEFSLRIAEVVVLARLGALMHDVCHLPYGHAVEDDQGILEAHDSNVWRFNLLWNQIDRFLARRLGEAGFADDYENLRSTLIDQEGRLHRSLRPLVLSKEIDPETKRSLPPAHERIDKYPFVADIVGNTICADLLDYLVRDHVYTGLPMELGDRFLSAFFVTSSNRKRFKQRMALSIVRADRERTDVISELLKHLRYRYEETERVLTHHAKLGADAMVGKALEMWRDHIEEKTATALSSEVSSPSVPRENGSGADVVQLVTDEITGHPDENPEQISYQDEKTSDASRHIETQMLARSDDGILEHLRDYCEEELASGEVSDAPRLEALRAIVIGLLDRDLYKPVDRVSGQLGSAAELYADFGDPAARRQLEQRAAAYAGMKDAWKLLIWLPPPDMRLKVAEVLVYDGADVTHFNESEAFRNKRGTDIYEAHQRLWGIGLYAHRTVTASQHTAARTYLAGQMEIRWDKMIADFGNDTRLWSRRLALREAAEALSKPLPRNVERTILEQEDREAVARSPSDGMATTHAALVARYKERLGTQTLGEDGY